MAFPSKGTPNKGATSAVNTTSHPISMPAHQAGDLLVVPFTAAGNSTHTASGTGWTSVTQPTGTSKRHTVFTKIATSGSEALTVTTGAATQSSHVAHRARPVTGGMTLDWVVNTPPDSGYSSNTYSGGFNPPAGAQDYLTLTTVGSTGNTEFSGISYGGGNFYSQAGASGSSCSTATMDDTVAGGSISDASFSGNPSDVDWTSFQIAIWEVPGGSSGVTVDLNVTDAADTLSGAADVTVGVSLDRTDVADTLSASATLPVSVALSATDANDTLSATAAVAISASLAVNDASDTLASTAGVTVSAALSVTDEADTLAATVVTGEAPVEVNLSVTDAADTLSATASLTVGVSLAVTDAADTLAASSTMPVTVGATVTDASDVLAATVGAVVGVALAVNDAPDTLAATAIVQQEGVVSVTLDVVDTSDTLAATAILGPAPQRSGSGGRNWWIDVPVDRRDVVVNVTDEDDTLAATATVRWSSSKVRRLMAQHAKQLAPRGRAVQISVVDADDVLQSRVSVQWSKVGLVRSTTLTRAGT